MAFSAKEVGAGLRKRLWGQPHNGQIETICKRFRDGFDFVRLCSKPRACTDESEKRTVFPPTWSKWAFALIIPWSCVRITPGLLRL